MDKMFWGRYCGLKISGFMLYTESRLVILLLEGTKPSDTACDKKNYFLLQRFIQYLASRNTLFNLSNFLDKSGSHGKPTYVYNLNKILNKILLLICSLVCKI